MKNKLLAILMVVALALVTLTGCAGNNTGRETQVTAAETVETATAETSTAQDTEQKTTGDSKPAVTIIYTNDIHSYVNNTVTDENGNTVPGLRISNVAALANDREAAGENVILVDAGDEYQGTLYGSFDSGRTVTDLMSAAGYDLATIGNHDFDFGYKAMKSNFEVANFEHICCNLIDNETGANAYEPYKIIEAGGVKVAFIGMLTPQTAISSLKSNYSDENGNPVYTFVGLENPQDMYDSVQEVINEVKDQADYVIALGHLGVGQNAKDSGISSEDLISNTTGLDAFIDGHSHNVMECEMVKDKDGNEIPLTQTGSYLAHIGIMTISENGEITTELIDEYDNADADVAELEKILSDYIEESNGQKIASLGTTMYLNNPDNESQRIIRAKETNLGDLITDAYYWYINEKMNVDCDMAIANGGSIRVQKQAGDFSYKDIKDILPFSNQIGVVKVKGEVILNALEAGATAAGEVNTETGAPAENPRFMQVAGLKYTINSQIASSVKNDADGNFISVDGAYRVTDVKVYNKKTGSYEDLDKEKYYNVAGGDFLIANGGDGMTMFKGSEIVLSYVVEDAEVLNAYITSFTAEDGYPLVSSKNSPLASYSGYLINYENPYGAERIVIK